ncbi:MAG: hypothetical protein F2934_12600 [Actinobacteria bacterium]|nr:hypothetical protein [Actinomycetota bacterium]MSZ05123.1 hypothetical protein [Actinomycetota bacterium]MTB07956.1 hypothetical protein [Actinomycetota bacterium]
MRQPYASACAVHATRSKAWPCSRSARPRGDATERSDIDLLVDIDVGNGLLPLIGLTEALEALLKFEVDVTPASLLKQDVAATALADAVAL